MSERRSTRRGGSGGEFSRRRVLGATALGVAGAGGLLASVAPARAATTDFGAVAVGTSRTRAITTGNPVSRPLEVTDITITGADAAAFTIVSGDAPFTVGPDESHTVRVAFEPTSTGEKSAAVRVETSIRSAVAGQLAGRGVEEGGASATGGGEDESDAEESDQPDGSGESETATEEASESDSGEESADDDSSAADGSAEDSSTDDSSGEETATDDTETDRSGDDASDADPSTDRTTADDPAEEDEGEDASADGSTATPAETSSESSRSATDDTDTDSGSASATTETGESLATRRGTDADSGTDSRSGVEDDPGALLTELLDVNDDGVVNLRDLLRIVRRLG